MKLVTMKRNKQLLKWSFHRKNESQDYEEAMLGEFWIKNEFWQNN